MPSSAQLVAARFALPCWSLSSTFFRLTTQVTGSRPVTTGWDTPVPTRGVVATIEATAEVDCTRRTACYPYSLPRRLRRIGLTTWDDETDVIVAGSGGGLVGAYTAAREGLSVMVVEA